MKEQQTVEELAHGLWGDMMAYQYEANRDWLIGIFTRLKIGGVWVYPDQRRTFKKIGDNKVIEI